MIVVIDYGMGNLRSVHTKVRRMGVDCVVSSERSDIEKAEKLILPGVGAFSRGMENLRSRNLVSALNSRVLESEVPILGICLGLQLFTLHSEEGDVDGLGWIEAQTRHLRQPSVPEDLKVPHIGWSPIRIQREAPILSGCTDQDQFYFVHSYSVTCADRSNVVATTFYGREFDSVVERGNIVGTQFHPEKSHGAGLRIIENFVRS